MVMLAALCNATAKTVTVQCAVVVARAPHFTALLSAAQSAACNFISLSAAWGAPLGFNSNNSSIFFGSAGLNAERQKTR